MCSTYIQHDAGMTTVIRKSPYGLYNIANYVEFVSGDLFAVHNYR